MKVSDPFGVFLFILLVWDRISQCSSGWSRTHRELPDSALWVLVSHVCASTLDTRGDVFSRAEAVFRTFCNYWSLFFSACALDAKIPQGWILCHRWAQCPLKEFFRALSFKRVLILLPTPADPISQFFLNEAINILLARPTLITLLLNRHRSWTHTWFGSIQTGIFLRPHLSTCLQPESLEATIRKKKWPHPLRIHQGRCCFNDLLAQFLPPQARRFILWPCFCGVSPGLLQSHREKESLILVCAMHQDVIKSWWLYLHFSGFLLPF